MQGKTFMQIVEREMRGEATEEEVAFLKSSDDNLKLWDDCLAMTHSDATDNVARLNVALKEEMDEYLSVSFDAWKERKREIERKKSATIYFIKNVRKKRLEIKTLRTSIKLGGESKNERRAAICSGYRRALHDINSLIEKRALPTHLAIEYMELYECQYMEAIWTKNPTAPADYSFYFDAWLDQFLAQRENNS